MFTIPDEVTPLAKAPQDLVTIDDEDTPLGGLPRTGGFPVGLLAVIGAVLFGAGYVLDRKKK